MIINNKMGKFRIKIIPWWVSDDYVQFKYSTNGIIWYKIHHSKRDVLDNYFYMEPLTIHYTDAERTVAKFQSINDIRNYEQIEKDKLVKYNTEKDVNDKLKSLEKEATYKRFNKLK